MISQKAKYALRALVALCKVPQGESVMISEISREQAIPKKFLEQILLELKRSGIVMSRRGRLGGYVLLKAPDERHVRRSAAADRRADRAAALPQQDRLSHAVPTAPTRRPARSARCSRTSPSRRGRCWIDHVGRRGRRRRDAALGTGQATEVRSWAEQTVPPSRWNPTPDYAVLLRNPVRGGKLFLLRRSATTAGFLLMPTKQVE